MARLVLPLLLAAGLPAPSIANSMVWQTSQAGDRLAALGPVVWTTTPPAAALTVQADFTSVRQTIIGFGGAFTESAAYNFAQLTPGNKSAVLALLVGSPDAGGNGLTMGRVAINSPDFALSDYSYANVTGDYNLSSFDHSLARDGMYVVPFVRAAIDAAARPLKLFATPWSPPAWMKVPFGGDIPRMDGSTLPGLEGSCNASWALYFSYWFAAMEATHADAASRGAAALGLGGLLFNCCCLSSMVDAANGQGGSPLHAGTNLTFWAYTAQNEPTAINATGVQWDACGYTAEGMAEFMRLFLGPVMQRDHPNIKLLIFDHNNDHVEEWADALYGDSYVSNIAFGTAIHWYAGSIFSLNSSHNAHPTRPILHTEGCNGVTGRNNYGNAETYARQMMQFLQAWSVTFNDWNLMLDTAGGPHHANGGLDAPLVNDGHGGFYVQPYFYAFGHFSRFLPEGTVINGAMVFAANATAPAPEGQFWYEFVGEQGIVPDFGALAGTMPNGTRVLIAANLGGAPVSAAVKARRSGPGGPFAWAALALPAHSMRTLTWEDAA